MRICQISAGLINTKKLIFPADKTHFKTKPYALDSVSFSSNHTNKVQRYLDINPDSAEKIYDSLHNSTSGHRAPYMSETFSPEAVKLIALGFARYAKEQNPKKPMVVIGGDTRRATRESLPEINDILTKQGVDVIYIKDPVPTPLLAMTAKKYDIETSILMTASHNPWEDGGFNFITKEGAIAPSEVTQQIAEQVKEISSKGSYFEDRIPEGHTIEYNPYNLYKNEIKKLGLIDFENISSSDLKVYYDGLSGTGSYVMPKLLKDFGIDYEEIKSSGQTGPNPTPDNLKELSQKVKESDSEFKIGIANDGDADRFGIIDENGNFIDPNDVILLVAHHLIDNIGLKGDIVRSQATSSQIDKVARKHNLKTHITPVGFKYIASDILQARKEGRDIIVAGEESGGLTTYRHIPEKDGVLADFLILDLVAYEKKPISQILKEVKEKLNVNMYIDNYSKRIKDNETKELILKKVEKRFNDALSGDVDFGDMHKVDIEKTISQRDNIKSYRSRGDGFKFFMTDGSSVLVRKSGTEPLLRFYIESFGQDDESAYQGACSLKNYIEENFN